MPRRAASAPCRRFLSLILAVLIVALGIHPAVTPASAGPAIQQQEQDARTNKEKKKKEEEEKGTLDSFEEEATSEEPDSLQAGEPVEAGSWWGLAGELFLAAFAVGAIGSWYRVTGNPPENDFEQHWGERQNGEVGVPFVGVNLSYQSVESDVEAYDGRIEGGYGPFAAQYRLTRFKEKDPATELDLSWLHGFLRLSYTRYVEMGLGFGAITLDGTNSEFGFSFALPFRVEPSRYFGFDYRPTWGWINGNTISDHDLGVRVGIRYVSIRGGYRWVKAGSSTLNGPVIGLLFSL